MAITGWREFPAFVGGGGGWTLGALRLWERRVRRADKAGKGRELSAGNYRPADVGGFDAVLAAWAEVNEGEGYRPRQIV